MNDSRRRVEEMVVVSLEREKRKKERERDEATAVEASSRGVPSFPGPWALGRRCICMEAACLTGSAWPLSLS